MQATGEFTIDLKPLSVFTDGREDNNLGRMSIEKIFQGDLTGTSRGEMLTGTMTIHIEDGKHSYVFDYQLS